MKNKYILLIVIVIIGLLLRFYMLGSMPVGLHTDEAYFGYNSFSILKTGREITGDLFPIHLKSFLFSPAAYSYFSIPFIFIFGLSPFSTRFASAFFGTITIILVYFLTRQLFVYTGQKEKTSTLVALLSALFFAISPWNINLSRVATENVIVVFLISLGAYLYLLWNDKKKIYFFIAAFVCFVIALFSYQAPRSFLPLFLPCLFLFTYIKKDNKKTLYSILAFLIVIIIPVFYILLSPELAFRIRTLSILQNPQTQLVLDEQLRENGVAGVSPTITRVFNNKALNYSQTFLNNYFKHFSYDFLFTDTGFPTRYKVPGMGILYLIDLPFILFGIWYLFNNNPKLGLFLTAWVLIAPIGSAFTFDDIPNLQRTLIVFPALSVISAAGALYFIQNLLTLKYKWVGRAVIAAIIVVMVYSLSFYLHAYYIQQKYHQPWYRQEGYRELVKEINNNSNKYNKVVITSSVGNPSIFLFFFNKMNPDKVQKIIKENTKNENYGEVSFDKYIISKDECPVREYSDINKQSGITKKKLIGEKGILYVDGGECETPEFGVKTIATIKRNDGTRVFKIFALE